MTRRPYGDGVLAPAFLGCVLYCIEEENRQNQFKEATGIDLRRLVGRSPIDAMIDKATGFEDKAFIGFCDWVAVNIWGEEEINKPKTKG